MIGPDLSNEFAAHRVWGAVQELLKGDLANNVDIDCIGEQDFDEEGMLTLHPPAARVVFLEEEAQPVENQNRNYTVDQRFAVLCADEDRGADPQAQRNKSLILAGAVKRSLVGARLVLGDGHTSEPVQYLGMKPMPTSDLGMAYVPAFKVGGIAYFPGAHAVPSRPEEGENNG